MVDVSRTPNITISANPPVGPTPGDLWWSPVTGQQYVWHDDGNTLQWVVSNWGAGKPGPAGLPAGVYINDIPPANPTAGTLWWSNAMGILFTWYDDGTSVQWVATGGAAAATFGPHTATVDMPITGYITITDADGITRKLAVIT